MNEPVRFEQIVILAGIVVTLTLAIVLMLLGSGEPSEASVRAPSPTVPPILAPASLLLAAQTKSEEVQREHVAEPGGRAVSDARPPLDAAMLAQLDSLLEAGASGQASPGASSSRGEAHLLTVETPTPALTSPYAAAARCGPSCWGAQLSRAEVEALALDVTGDAAWSGWAGRCFTGGGENRGYVGAVGGPNRNGTYDLGLGQSNTATLAGLGYSAARVLTDVRYAMQALYATWQAQGYGAWFGCTGGAE